MSNPFERYDLDPREGIGAITQRLKELAEEAKDDVERARIREAWEELTLHPARRFKAALFAHPETRGALGAPPSLPRRHARQADHAAVRLELRELAARPSVLVAVGGSEVADEDEVPSLEDDPVLRGLP